MDNNNEVNAIKELSTFNKNAEILIKLLQKGVEAGGISLSNENNVSTFRSLSHTLCDVSRFFLQHANPPESIIKPPIGTLQVSERPRDNISSLNESVHNLDVTLENGVAYEPSSSPGVSEFGDDFSEDGACILLSSSDDEEVDNSNPARRRIPDKNWKKKLVNIGSITCDSSVMEVSSCNKGKKQKKYKREKSTPISPGSIKRRRVIQQETGDDEEEDKSKELEDDKEKEGQEQEEMEEDEDEDDGTHILHHKKTSKESRHNTVRNNGHKQSWHKSSIRKKRRIIIPEDEDDDGDMQFQPFNNSMHDISQVMEYLSNCCRHYDPQHDSCVVRNNNLVLNKYLIEVINECDRDKCSHHEQSLVIFKHVNKKDLPFISRTSASQNSSTCSNDSRLDLRQYFEKCIVTQMSVIERSHQNYQVYIAKKLSKYFHFSCPTHAIVRLFLTVREYNNKEMEITFIPRSCEIYTSEEFCVTNSISTDEEALLIQESQFKELLRIINETGVVSNSSSKKTSTCKRTDKSISIGLQTIYSHEQHKSRYCMLPHSTPFVPSAKKRDALLLQKIREAYLFSSKVVRDFHKRMKVQGHPFSIEGRGDMTHEERNIRTRLRCQLYHAIFGGVDDEGEQNFKCQDTMFESCSVQTTGKLHFHRDVLNCPKMDETVAVHVPSQHDFGDKCISFLFYTRKCVGDFSKKRASMEEYLINSKTNCKLTILCLKSILEVNGIFNYLGSLFESNRSFKSIASSLQRHPEYQCHEVAQFAGLSCIKHGAAFDKMGYYSVFLNVLLSFHYLRIIQTVDDVISLCIYFGLLCNGTSNLAAAWKDIEADKEYALEYLSHHKKNTSLFSLLIKMEENRRKKDSINTKNLGSCKLPRYQYANYSAHIVQEIDLIHCFIKDFMYQNNRTSFSTADSDYHHGQLYDTLQTVKGIGPLSYNQLWHSLCLSGILPLNYIQSLAVAATSGPGKLIQTFYPKCKSERALLIKMNEVKGVINGLGLTRINKFVLENGMCELYRLGVRTKLVTQKMNVQERRRGYASEQFHDALVRSPPTKNPDLYFLNPFTMEWQHLFRVGDKGLQMRPSFLDNCDTSSSNLNVVISYGKDDEVMTVSIDGPYLKKARMDPSILFIS